MFVLSIVGYFVSRSQSASDGDTTFQGLVLLPRSERRPLDPISFQDLETGEAQPQLQPGQITVLNFWASWCTPCLEEIPSMLRLVEQFKLAPINVLAITMDEDLSAAQKFRREHMPRVRNWRVSRNLPHLSKSLGVYRLPTSVVLDKKSRVAIQGVSPKDWDSIELSALLQQLANEPITE